MNGCRFFSKKLSKKSATGCIDYFKKNPEVTAHTDVRLNFIGKK